MRSLKGRFLSLVFLVLASYISSYAQTIPQVNNVPWYQFSKKLSVGERLKLPQDTTSLGTGNTRDTTGLIAMKDGKVYVLVDSAWSEIGGAALSGDTLFIGSDTLLLTKSFADITGDAFDNTNLYAYFYNRGLPKYATTGDLATVNVTVSDKVIVPDVGVLEWSATGPADGVTYFAGLGGFWKVIIRNNSTIFENGLVKILDTVRLGAALNRHTTVTLGAYSYSYKTSSGDSVTYGSLGYGGTPSISSSNWLTMLLKGKYLIMPIDPSIPDDADAFPRIQIGVNRSSGGYSRNVKYAAVLESFTYSGASASPAVDSNRNKPFMIVTTGFNGVSGGAGDIILRPGVTTGLGSNYDTRYGNFHVKLEPSGTGTVKTPYKQGLTTDSVMVWRAIDSSIRMMQLSVLAAAVATPPAFPTTVGTHNVSVSGGFSWDFDGQWKTSLLYDGFRWWNDFGIADIKITEFHDTYPGEGLWVDRGNLFVDEYAYINNLNAINAIIDTANIGYESVSQLVASNTVTDNFRQPVITRVSNGINDPTGYTIHGGDGVIIIDSLKSNNTPLKFQVDAVPGVFQHVYVKNAGSLYYPYTFLNAGVTEKPIDLFGDTVQQLENNTFYTFFKDSSITHGTKYWKLIDKRSVSDSTNNLYFQNGPSTSNRDTLLVNVNDSTMMAKSISNNSGSFINVLKDIQSEYNDYVYNLDTASADLKAYIAANSGATAGITTLTGDVTASGTGSVAATITNGAVTNAKLADMATATIKGRATAGTGDPEDLTPSQARTVMNLKYADWDFYEDFLQVGYNGWLQTFTGNGAFMFATPIQALDQMGVCRLYSGTSSSAAYTAMATANDGLTFSTTPLEVDVKDVTVGHLNTGTDSAQYIVGFFDNAGSNSNPIDGAYFIYESGSTFWKAVTISNGIKTETITPVTVGVGIANSIDISIRATSTEVVFTIYGQSPITHTTNIPSGLSRTFQVGYAYKKRLGTGENFFDVDRFLFKRDN